MRDATIYAADIFAFTRCYAVDMRTLFATLTLRRRRHFAPDTPDI